MNTSSTSVVKDTSLNALEKKSFYSFLILYISSSFFFVTLSGFWYYKAQKNALEKTVYYKLQHYGDTIGGRIINAQMHKTPLLLPKIEKGYEYSLVQKNENKKFATYYFHKDSYTYVVSASPQEHLGIKYVVVKTDAYTKGLQRLQRGVFFVVFSVFAAIAFISYLLSKLFMRPIHQKMLQIEDFVHDISHELNTPVTALQLSAKRALQKRTYDERILKNILISTKQLYSIYKSLAYLNFDTKEKEVQEINLKKSVIEVIEFYAELCHAKNITVNAKLEDAFINIDEEKAKLLFSNLLSNSIKYSMPYTTITIKLANGSFTIQDEGEGIPKEKLTQIFELYERDSSVAGGFGIGLYIVKKICAESGIKLSLDSEVGIGSTFYLSWDT